MKRKKIEGVANMPILRNAYACSQDPSVLLKNRLRELRLAVGGTSNVAALYSGSLCSFLRKKGDEIYFTL